jgi:hypothetical protein
MFRKIAIILLIATFASAQDFVALLARIKAERGEQFAENPCSGRSGAHFARNSRGCSWYFACNTENEVIRQDRCPGKLR